MVDKTKPHFHFWDARVGKNRQARDLRTEKQHSGEYPWFPFCLLYPRLGAEDAGKWNMWPIKDLNKFKRIDIIQSMFSDPDGIKPEMNNKKSNEKIPNMWKLNMPLNNQWVKEV